MRQPALPGDAPVERVKWDELEPGDQLTVLYWLKEAIHKGVKKVVVGTGYQLFASAVGQGKEFNPAQVWNSLPPRTTDHFRHARAYELEIDEMIDEIEAELDDDEDDNQGDPLAFEGQSIHFDGLGVQREDVEEVDEDGSD